LVGGHVSFCNLEEWTRKGRCFNLGKNNVDMKKEENAPKEVVRYY
jgi:hypothetical protein